MKEFFEYTGKIIKFSGKTKTFLLEPNTVWCVNQSVNQVNVVGIDVYSKNSETSQKILLPTAAFQKIKARSKRNTSFNENEVMQEDVAFTSKNELQERALLWIDNLVKKIKGHHISANYPEIRKSLDQFIESYDFFFDGEFLSSSGKKKNIDFVNPNSTTTKHIQFLSNPPGLKLYNQGHHLKAGLFKFLAPLEENGVNYLASIRDFWDDDPNQLISDVYNAINFLNGAYNLHEGKYKKFMNNCPYTDENSEIKEKVDALEVHQVNKLVALSQNALEEYQLKTTPLLLKVKKQPSK